VEDMIEVEEQSPIHAKGVSVPIRTYKAIGKKTSSVTDVIHEEREGLRVDVDLTKANKDEAISLLKAAIERIRSDKG